MVFPRLQYNDVVSWRIIAEICIFSPRDSRALAPITTRSSNPPMNPLCGHLAADNFFHLENRWPILSSSSYLSLYIYILKIQENENTIDRQYDKSFQKFHPLSSPAKSPPTLFIFFHGGEQEGTKVTHPRVLPGARSCANISRRVIHVS